MQQAQTSHRYARPSPDAPSTDASMKVRSSVAAVVREAAASRLFLMTTLGAATGQVPMLAAEGLLASPATVVTAGLTVVAGVGAYTTALEEASLGDAWGRRVFTATALLSILVNVAAAGAGLALAHAVRLEHLRLFIALALALIAWEVASGSALRLPLGQVHCPLPAAVIALGYLVEVLV